MQPEQTFLAHVRRAGGITRTVRNALIYHSVVFAGLIALAGADIVWWIAVTRLGSTASWMIFDWVMHHPRLWGRSELPLSRALHVVERAVHPRQPGSSTGSAITRCITATPSWRATICRRWPTSSRRRRRRRRALLTS